MSDDEDTVLEMMRRAAERRHRIADSAGRILGWSLWWGAVLALFVVCANGVENCHTCLERGGTPVRGMVGPVCLEPRR